MKEQQIMKASRKQKSAARQTKIRRAAEHFLLHGGKESAGQQTKMSSATDFIEPAAKSSTKTYSFLNQCGLL
ncbi:MAG: hypothetical protein IJ417_03420 [Bacteroidaceae bacterium]|nr:hypothetical protein [Bacteroidaceae bacterium]